MKENLNKQYGTYIIISGHIYREVKDEFVCRFLGIVSVKGKEKPTKIFELISKKPHEEEKFATLYSEAASQVNQTSFILSTEDI